MSNPDTIDLTRPEVTVGYAMVDKNDRPFPTTVAATERGAIVNALVSIWGVPIYAHEIDAAIEAKFHQHAKRAYRISEVAIETIDVATTVPEEVSA